MQVNEILETCLYADDLDAAAQWYRDVLGLAMFARQPGRHVFFRCGRRCLFLFHAKATQARDGGPIDIPPHGAVGAGHVCFAVPEADLDRWRGHFARHGVDIERVIDWPNGGRSLYVRDPAGNSVELATPRIWGISERGFFHA